MDEDLLGANLGLYSGGITLSKGWMGFIFKSLEDSTLILNKFWSYGGGSLMLKRWRVGFNPETEYFSFRHLWILLSGLPLAAMEPSSP
jgi:hypothetical protein